MKPKKDKKPDQGAPKWMTTYSDMITLILVFFILLFSMSQIDAAKFEAVAESFKERMVLDFFPSAVPLDHPTDSPNHEDSGKEEDEFTVPDDTSDEDNNEVDPDKEDDLDTLLRQIQEYLDEQNLNDVITATRTQRGVVLVLQDSILFRTGEAEILDDAKPFLSKVGGLLEANQNHVIVEGHTDVRPISNYRYPSNWELSGARASIVVRYLVQNNDFSMDRFSIAGYGSTRPVEEGMSQESLKKNRRVEIVILDSEAEK